MTKAEREKKQRESNKLMHKLGGRHSREWFNHRVKVNAKVYKTIANQKYGKFMRNQKLQQLHGAQHATNQAIQEMK